jgi:stringent starvation protein B
MTSNQPYLLRAIHEWLTDNDEVPYILVDATKAGLDMLSEHVRDGVITLNVSYQAVEGLYIDNDFISFKARFNGQSQAVSLPVNAVLGIYGRDTGEGMMFAPQSSDDGTTDDENPQPETTGFRIID